MLLVRVERDLLVCGKRGDVGPTEGDVPAFDQISALDQRRDCALRLRHIGKHVAYRHLNSGRFECFEHLVLLRRAGFSGFVQQGAKLSIDLVRLCETHRAFDLFFYLGAAHLRRDHQTKRVHQQAEVALLHPVRKLDLFRREDGVGLDDAQERLEHWRGFSFILFFLRLIFHHADDESFALTVAAAERHEHMTAHGYQHAIRYEVAVEPVYVCVRDVYDDFTDAFHAVHLLL